VEAVAVELIDVPSASTLGVQVASAPILISTLFSAAMKPAFNAMSVVGGLAYGLLALMLGAPLLEWLQRAGLGVPLGLLVLGLALWLVRRPLTRPPS
jgi:hypothetical protein